jgi:hypothetical protein
MEALSPEVARKYTEAQDPLLAVLLEHYDMHFAVREGGLYLVYTGPAAPTRERRCSLEEVSDVYGVLYCINRLLSGAG